MPDRRQFHQAAAALALGALAGPLRAQTGAAAVPATTVLWSGFPPGGLGDQVTRPLLDKLRGRYPSAMVLESKPGAGGRIAADFVKRATPDGATLLQTPSSVVALYPHLYPKLPYQPLTDFIPVVPMCSYAVCFTAGPGLPADIRSLADYLRWAKASPANTHYGIPAAGSALHFAGMRGAQQRALPRRRAAAAGSAGRPDPGQLQCGQRGAAACAQRQITGAGHHQPTALAGPARGADHG